MLAQKYFGVRCTLKAAATLRCTGKINKNTHAGVPVLVLSFSCLWFDSRETDLVVVSCLFSTCPNKRNSKLTHKSNII